MPQRMGQRVRIKVVDCLCGVMLIHGVVPTLDLDILWVSSTIWKNIPHDMTTLMHHIVGIVNLIERLRDDVDVSHDSTPSSSSLDRSTSSTPPHDPPPPDHASPPHVSIPSFNPLASPPHVYAPSTFDPPLPPPPPPPPHVYAPSIDPLVPSPAHVSTPSMFNPPPPPPPPYLIYIYRLKALQNRQ
jgi:hypothetical protein